MGLTWSINRACTGTLHTIISRALQPPHAIMQLSV